MRERDLSFQDSTHWKKRVGLSGTNFTHLSEKIKIVIVKFHIKIYCDQWIEERRFQKNEKMLSGILTHLSYFTLPRQTPFMGRLGQTAKQQCLQIYT